MYLDVTLSAILLLDVGTHSMYARLRGERRASLRRVDALPCLPSFLNLACPNAHRHLHPPKNPSPRKPPSTPKPCLLAYSLPLRSSSSATAPRPSSLPVVLISLPVTTSTGELAQARVGFVALSLIARRRVPEHTALRPRLCQLTARPSSTLSCPSPFPRTPTVVSLPGVALVSPASLLVARRLGH